MTAYRRIWTLVLISLAGFATGCCSTLKPAELNEQGRFETNTVLYDVEVTLNGDFKDEYSALVYIKTDEKVEQYNDFFVETVNNMGVFDQVVDQAGMESLVFERELANGARS